MTTFSPPFDRSPAITIGEIVNKLARPVGFEPTTTRLGGANLLLIYSIKQRGGKKRGKIFAPLLPIQPVEGGIT
jgi:hypothetical protein